MSDNNSNIMGTRYCWCFSVRLLLIVTLLIIIARCYFEISVVHFVEFRRERYPNSKWNNFQLINKCTYLYNINKSGNAGRILTVHIWYVCSISAINTMSKINVFRSIHQLRKISYSPHFWRVLYLKKKSICCYFICMLLWYQVNLKTLLAMPFKHRRLKLQQSWKKLKITQKIFAVRMDLRQIFITLLVD